MNIIDHTNLTALPDRHLLFEKITAIISDCEKRACKSAVLFIDLDRFKVINDTQGHATGDKLLIEAAQRIQSCLTEKDLIARYGGDEFIAILPFKDSTILEATITRIIEKLSEVFYINRSAQFIGASVGISLFPDNGQHCDDLIQKADIAMFSAKQDGRGKYVYFSVDMQDAILEKKSLETDLYQAIQRNEIYLMYQPQISLSTNQISGVEALIRWHHRRKGEISPEKFIPQAEQNGFIITLGNWVIHQALKQCALWHEKRLPTPQRIAINISVKQLLHDDFLTNVENIISKFNIGNTNIEFEITENIFLDDDKKIIELFRNINQLGIALAIDDFGKGYSSLSRLKNLPVQIFKLDRLFIQDIATDRDALAIVKAIVAMGKELNKEIIIEGVETTEQFNILKDLGCHHVQGYHLSKPKSDTELPKVINSSVFPPQDSKKILSVS